MATQALFCLCLSLVLVPATAVQEHFDIPLTHSRKLASQTFSFDSGVKTGGGSAQLSGSVEASIDTEKGASLKVQSKAKAVVPDIAGQVIGNYAEFDGSLTISSDPCNVFFWSATVQGSLEFKLGVDKADCVGGNLNACLELAVDKLDFADIPDDKWVLETYAECSNTASATADKAKDTGKNAASTGTKAAGKYTSAASSYVGGRRLAKCTLTSTSKCTCATKHKIIIPPTTVNIDLKGTVESLKIKLSDMVGLANKGVAQMMKLSGTDVVWSIMPGTFKAYYSGMQTGIQMDLYVVDPTKSSNGAFKTAGTAMKTAGVQVPIYAVKKDFVKLVAELAPSTTFPNYKDTFVVDKATGLITVGKVTAECDSAVKDFELTVTGLPTDATEAKTAQGLAVLLKEAAPHNKLLPKCDVSTKAVGSFPVSVMCPFKDVTIDGTKIKGKVVPYAGISAGGINKLMKDHVAAGTAKLTVVSTTALPVEKESYTGEGCSESEKAAAGDYAAQACEGAANTDIAGPTEGEQQSSGTLLGAALISLVPLLGTMAHHM